MGHLVEDSIQFFAGAKEAHVIRGTSVDLSLGITIAQQGLRQGFPL